MDESEANIELPQGMDPVGAVEDQIEAFAGATITGLRCTPSCSTSSRTRSRRAGS